MINELLNVTVISAIRAYEGRTFIFPPLKRGGKKLRCRMVTDVTTRTACADKSANTAHLSQTPSLVV
jgi:hypothetical protein